MADKPKILIQIDPDPQASTFDAVVAIDAGVDRLLTRAGVQPDQVESLVHGAMFTRGGDDLASTALFFGGTNVAVCESLVAAARQSFFGPVRVSLMSDPNGSNTTAAAAVRCIQRHVDLSETTTTILGGTGPVGLRVAQLIGRNATGAAEIRIGSRSIEKAEQACQQLKQQLDDLGNTPSKFSLVPVATDHPDAALAAVEGAHVLVAAGAAGVELIDQRWQSCDSLQAVVDVNAVPPAGIAGVEVVDSGKARGPAHCYGAIGVGNLKMKIHRRAIQQLFTSHDQVLDTETIYEIATAIEADSR